MVWLSDFTGEDKHYMISLDDVSVYENHEANGTQTILHFLFEDGTEYEMIVDGKIKSEEFTHKGKQF